MKRKILLFLLVLLLLPPLWGRVAAQEQDQGRLEITYPEVSGITPVATGTEAVPKFIEYLFNLGIALAGIVSFLAILFGGVKYLTSAGNPTMLSDARAQMMAGILGLAVLLGSYL